MKEDYETHKGTATHLTKEENSDSDSSDKSIRWHERAYACYRPEAGESNAESAERHQRIEDLVRELNEIRRRKRNRSEYPVRLEHTFATSTRLTCTINNKQRRATTKRNSTQPLRRHHDNMMTTKYQQIWDRLSTPMYRHDRCPQCDKPVSTTNINILVDMTCYECQRINANWNMPNTPFPSLRSFLP
jgi:hypothetical protein